MSPPNKVEKSGSMDFGHRKGSGTMFAGLQQYKREDGDASQKRRESLQDIQPKGGFISNFWNSTFKHGPSK
ncbi:hypothetical protein CB0940_11434 [Cercospora beticola]|uniref:Conidiation-specific protein 8 n=1 Tax=Cercospora beticola TaxID=122368 RepID=A0A2G5HE61_CERBT|nr:hypothetical protein CB0940_11434 [Cercospora beticola]PIA90841.1 hypothetical protein CB0940_11434 [Cercospora beticola]WPB08288.1 hypothetical protein RHO25_012954 [Cercospora beticola]CAK1367831.1 unnamed protein product [Cercospora beticola]